MPPDRSVFQLVCLSPATLSRSTLVPAGQIVHPAKLLEHIAMVNSGWPSLISLNRLGKDPSASRFLPSRSTPKRARKFRPPSANVAWRYRKGSACPDASFPACPSTATADRSNSPSAGTALGLERVVVESAGFPCGASRRSGDLAGIADGPHAAD